MPSLSADSMMDTDTSYRCRLWWSNQRKPFGPLSFFGCVSGHPITILSPSLFFPHHLNLLGPDDGQGGILIWGDAIIRRGEGGQDEPQPPPSNGCIKRAGRRASERTLYTQVALRAHEHPTSFLLFSLYWSALVNKAGVCENLITATQSRISSED